MKKRHPSTWHLAFALAFALSCMAAMSCSGKNKDLHPDVMTGDPNAVEFPVFAYSANTFHSALLAKMGGTSVGAFEQDKVAAEDDGYVLYYRARSQDGVLLFIAKSPGGKEVFGASFTGPAEDRGTFDKVAESSIDLLVGDGVAFYAGLKDSLEGEGTNQWAEEETEKYTVSLRIYGDSISLYIDQK